MSDNGAEYAVGWLFNGLQDTEQEMAGQSLTYGKMQRDSVFEFFTIELRLTLKPRDFDVKHLRISLKAGQWSGELERMVHCQIKQSIDIVCVIVTNQLAIYFAGKSLSSHSNLNSSQFTTVGKACV